MADLQNTRQQQTPQVSELQTEANGHVEMIIDRDSIQYKIIQAYSERKNPRDTHFPQSNGSVEAPVPSAKDHKTGKRRRRIKLSKLLRCIRPVKEDDDPVRFRPSPASAGSDEEVEGIVSRLTEITDSVHFYPSDIECDSGVSLDSIERIVEILREQGDELDEKIKKDQRLMQDLQGLVSYGFYQKITEAFFKRLSPEEVPPAKNPDETRIALICELTSRLKIIDRHPMNRVLGFGAKYLQDNHAAWLAKQGGCGEVFSKDHNAEESEEMKGSSEEIQ